MKKLKIAQIVPLWVPVPPKKYGGIERIASYLTEELVKRGHEVTLFASGDSKTKAKLISVYPRSLLKDNISWTDHLWNLENLSYAFSRAKEFDVIHSHLDVWSVFFQEIVKTPVIHTFHNPLYAKKGKKITTNRLKIFDRHKKGAHWCYISKSQKQLSPLKIRQSSVVYNGIDTSLFKFNPKPKDYFVWIARIDPYKGIENAIAAAEMTGVKLLLAGRLDKAMKDYFNQRIKPHLGRKIKYVGELSQKELSDFYGNAIASLYPIEWHEPFGLVMVESMACGTPVISFARGSVREVVKNGYSGYVLPMMKKEKRNIKGLAKAIENIREIKREDCRTWVEKNFSYQKMTDRYEKIYYKLAQR